MKLCPEEKPWAYDDGDMCCKSNKELEDGGNSGEFVWKYLCKKRKNFYLHLGKLWQLDDTTLKSKDENWPVEAGDKWSFLDLTSVLHFYMISDVNVLFRQS